MNNVRWELDSKMSACACQRYRNVSLCLPPYFRCMMIDCGSKFRTPGTHCESLWWLVPGMGNQRGKCCEGLCSGSCLPEVVVVPVPTRLVVAQNQRSFHANTRCPMVLRNPANEIWWRSRQGLVYCNLGISVTWGGDSSCHT